MNNMNYKNSLLLGSAILIVIGISLPIIKKRNALTDSTITIGIIQTASHPALDQACQGFIEGLKDKLKNVTYILLNAQGSIAQAHTIAQRFHINDAIKIVYAIATPAAQAIATVEQTAQQKKPIIFTAVSDPSVLGAQANITGVTDMVDSTQIVDLIVQLIPAAKTVAILYSSAEINSVHQVQLLKNELEKHTLIPLEIGIAQESDIPTALMLACRKADVLLCPTDNALATAMQLVAVTARTHKKPLFACYNQAVEQGALAACGVDYTACGKQAAEIAYSIIVQNKKPENLPILTPHSDTVYINKNTLDALGLAIPETVTQQICIVS